MGWENLSLVSLEQFQYRGSLCPTGVYIELPLYIPFNLGYPGLGSCQPVKGPCDGLPTPSDLYVVAVAPLSDGSHDASLCQICAKGKKAPGI